MKYKLSYYTVITDNLHPDSGEDGTQVIYATRMGKALSVKKKYMDMIKEGRFEELPLKLFSTLIKYEAIVPQEEDELLAVVTRSKNFVEDEKYVNFTIMPSAHCQLGCGYCGQSHAKDNMTSDMIFRIADRVREVLASGRYEVLDIAWFGAEPLVGLKNIRALSPLLHEIAAEYGCDYNARIITNGLSLKEKIYWELLEKHKITSFEITLDGTAEYHDQRRHTKEGTGTFDIIMRNLLNILNNPKYDETAGGSINIRCNVDKKNVDGVVPLIHQIADYKLQDKVNLYFATVYSWGNDAHLTAFTRQEYADLEIEWYIEMMKVGFKIQPIPGKVSFACYALTPHSELYDSYGNIFNCSEAPQVASYKDDPYYNLGKLEDSPIIDPVKKPFTDWLDRVEDQDPSIWCPNCKIFPVCGGNCPKLWDDKLPPCPSYKFNIEDRLALSYIYSKSNLLDPVVEA
ncbi:MAG: radical SAM protein [Bacteroidota bacterium]